MNRIALDSWEMQRLLIAASTEALEMKFFEAMYKSESWLQLAANKADSFEVGRVWEVVLGFFCWHGRLDSKVAALKLDTFMYRWEKLRLEMLSEQRTTENGREDYDGARSDRDHD